jgi:cell division protein FtsW (lipid II flippase)
MVAVLQKKTFRDFDWLVAALAILIVAFGVWEIRNAQPRKRTGKNRSSDWRSRWWRCWRLLSATIGGSSNSLRFSTCSVCCCSIVVLVPGIGVKVNGQRCWIQLGPLGSFNRLSYEDSVVLMLAKVYGKHRTGR